MLTILERFFNIFYQFIGNIKKIWPIIDEKFLKDTSTKAYHCNIIHIFKKYAFLWPNLIIRITANGVGWRIMVSLVGEQDSACLFTGSQTTCLFGTNSVQFTFTSFQSLCFICMYVALLGIFNEICIAMIYTLCCWKKNKVVFFVVRQ